MICDRLMNHSSRMVSFPSCEHAGEFSDQPVSIGAGTVHLWGFSLEARSACLKIYARWLDVEEQSRAGRLVHEEDRRRYVLAHGSLRALLSRYVRCSPDAIRLDREAAGKPYLLINNAQEPVTFSMAHSRDRLVIAVTSQDAVGVDLEHIRRTVEVIKLADRFYRPSERARLAGLRDEQRLRQFFRYWVAKEAVLKGEGIGLSSLQDCEVLATEAHDKATVHVLADKPLHRNWTVQWLSCGTGWEGAVACPGERNVRVMVDQ